MINNQKTKKELQSNNIVLRAQLLAALAIIFIGTIYLGYITYLENSSNYGGAYNSFTGTIKIYNKILDLQKRDYFYLHERCHAYYYELLPEEARQRYNQVYQNSTEFPTEYSKKNVMEDFADSCRMFLVGTLYDKPRLNFFNKHRYALSTIKTKI